MILRLIALRVAVVAAVPACVLAAAGAVIGIDRCLARCWPDLEPANGLLLSLGAPWGVVLVAIFLSLIGQVMGSVRPLDGAPCPVTSR